MANKEELAFDRKEKGFKEIKWIPCKNLSVIWVEAQRALDENRAQSIADNFDPEMFGTLSVTQPNGRGVYHIIDGHHRKVAVERKWGEDEMVPCQVFDAEDPARAAQLFVTINTARKSPQPVETFKVRVVAGDEVEVAVDKIVRACGYLVGFRQHGTNYIGCVASLKGVYQSYGSKTLADTLNTISAIWGVDDQSATGANIVRGVGEFLSEYRDINFTRLRERIGGKYTPARLQGAAKAYKELHGGTMSGAVRELMAVCYNEGLRTPAKRLQRKSSKGGQ